MPDSEQQSKRYQEELTLSEAAKYLLDECRMVLPGIQALFGFQLIAVFNSAFHGGSIYAQNRKNGGAIIRFQIPFGDSVLKHNGGTGGNGE